MNSTFSAWILAPEILPIVGQDSIVPPPWIVFSNTPCICSLPDNLDTAYLARFLPLLGKVFYHTFYICFLPNNLDSQVSVPSRKSLLPYVLHMDWIHMVIWRPRSWILPENPETAYLARFLPFLGVLSYHSFCMFLLPDNASASQGGIDRKCLHLFRSGAYLSWSHFDWRRSPRLYCVHHIS